MTPDARKNPVGSFVVTAIVSTYNSERFIRGCLEDLTGQTLFAKGALEIVVVDSGSPQNEGTIVREFMEKFGTIVYIRTEERETVYHAWNRAIQVASGRYITNANTDDRHRPDALEIMAGMLDSNPTIDLVYADVLITRTPNETFASNNATGKYEWFPWDRNTLLGVGCFIGPQPMWRRSLHDFYGWFDPGLVTSGDYEFWLRISQTSEFQYIPEPLGLYLEHDASIEHMHEQLKLRENSEILSVYRQAADEGRIIRCLTFEQLRSAVKAEGNTLNTLMTNMMKIDALISGGKNNTEALMHPYRQSECGMFALPLTAEHVETYIRAAETLLLSSRVWFGNYHKNGATGAVASLVREQLVATALQDARREARQGRIDKAVEIILRQAISVHSQSPLPYVELAELLVSAKRYEDAMQVLPEAPENTDRIWMCEIAAICHAALGDDKQAESAAVAVLRQKGERSRPLEALGTLAVRHGRTMEAEELFRRAASAEPGRGEPLLAMGMLCWSRGALQEAFRLLYRSVELSPLNPDAAGLLHEAARRLVRIPDFLELMQSILGRFPDARHILLELVDAFSENGNISQALSLLERGIVLIGCDDDLLDLALSLRRQLAPHNGSQFMGVPTVSLCMIVRDESACLPRCLASARPVVDEIIVVDTGSIDRTADVAEVFGAKVCHYRWENDFAAARNHALEKAGCEWVLVLDADEALSEHDYELVARTLKSCAGKMVAWRITTRNYTNRSESEGWQANDGSYQDQEQGDGWYPSYKVRLFPVSASIRFCGDIHEMVETDLRHLGIPIELADFVVHHYGELEEKDRRAKQLRYYEMGKAKLAGHPDDRSAIAELALQAGQLGFFEEALEYWDRLLVIGITVRDVFFNRAYALMGLHRYTEALASAEKALELEPDHKESQLNAAICELHTGNLENAWQRVGRLSEQYREWPLLAALRLALAVIAGESQVAVDCHTELCRHGYGVGAYLQELQRSLILVGQPVFAGQLAIWAKEAGYGSGE